MLKVNIKEALRFIDQSDYLAVQETAEKARKTLLSKTGAGNEYLGWLNWPVEYDQNEVLRIMEAAKTIQADSDCLVVIGIGGSYLGAKAVLVSLEPYFPQKEKKLEIIFAGHTLSPSYLEELLTYLEDKDFSINVISKSGTTTEPAIAFRFLKDLLIEKYGKDAYERIYATTDPVGGALRTQAKELGYQAFSVPSNIGGRYSVLTAVGLLPLAAAGIDIYALLEGAKKAQIDAFTLPFSENPAMQYASMRYLMDQKLGKLIEVLVTYEPKLSYICEWWKQLFGESEGKNHKGLFPASLVFSTDLHSLGQYIQEGKRTMFETVLSIDKSLSEIEITEEDDDMDQLNYLAGTKVEEVNRQAMRGTLLAHVDGGVPNIQIQLSALDEENIGYLLYFFMFSCGLSCYMTGVNPFNQPGVESYKRNMFALLGKKGFEDLRQQLEERLKVEEK